MSAEIVIKTHIFATRLVLPKVVVGHILNLTKTAMVRELRFEFPCIELWVHKGEFINVSKRGKVIAKLVPALGATVMQPRRTKK